MKNVFILLKSNPISLEQLEMWGAIFAVVISASVMIYIILSIIHKKIKKEGN